MHRNLFDFIKRSTSAIYGYVKFANNDLFLLNLIILDSKLTSLNIKTDTWNILLISTTVFIYTQTAEGQSDGK